MRELEHRTAPHTLMWWLSVWFRRAAAALLGLGLAEGVARAVIFFSTADPDHNTTAPTQDLAGSGWQWQGNWRGFAGTPIATNWFLTAKHLGGGIGEEFMLDGGRYRTTAFFDDPASDLRLWRVCGRFPSFATLCNRNDEAGRVCVVFGRGLSRGLPMVVTNASQTELRGWRWGSNAGVLRWGLNRVKDYEDFGDEPHALLRGTFDAEGESDEAMLASGDSGGGVFIARGNQWELAGIAYAVDGPFRYAAAGESFNAALFDRRGFYEEATEGWEPIPSGPSARPAAFYASRISVRKAWIEETMAANPEPVPVPEVLSAPTVSGPFQPTPATVDEGGGMIRFPVPGPPMFYRLSACQARRITSVTVTNEVLLFQYE